jgi:hypothetical protein
MGITLPRQIAVASTWTLNDFVTMAKSSPPAAGGICEVAFDQLDPNERWFIDHAVISCDSTTPTVLRLYEGAVNPLYLLDGSGSGAFDVADWPGGLAVQPTRTLIARWTGASAGAIGTVTLQARVLRRI